MKTALRTILFSYLAVLTSQYIINAISYKGDTNQSFYLFVLALSALYFFIRPMLKIVALPSEGIGFLFMNFVLTIILLQALIAFVPVMVLLPSEISDLIIFGFVLPSKSLTAFWSGVFVSLIISTVYTFLDWLCPKK
jgi:hypothetical protein